VTWNGSTGYTAAASMGTDEPCRPVACLLRGEVARRRVWPIGRIGFKSLFGRISSNLLSILYVFIMENSSQASSSEDVVDPNKAAAHILKNVQMQLWYKKKLFGLRPLQFLRFGETPLLFTYFEICHDNFCLPQICHGIRMKTTRTQLQVYTKMCMSLYLRSPINDMWAHVGPQVGPHVSE
jgi:hypothetical protein